jgi:hypothetical protein
MAMPSTGQSTGLPTSHKDRQRLRSLCVLRGLWWAAALTRIRFRPDRNR